MKTILKRASCIVLLLAIFAALPQGALCQSAGDPAAAPALGLPEYIAQLDRCSAVLDGSASDAAALHNLRTSLPKKWNVNEDGATYTVATDWLADGLASIEANPRPDNPALRQLRQTLAAYREAAQQMETQASSQDIAQSRARLNQILNAKEFRGAEGPSWFDMWKARIWEWIIRHLAKLFGGVHLSHNFGDGIAWTLIALVALLLIFWVTRYLLQTGSRSEMNLRDASAVGRNWHHWLREARAAAERGDYRAAIHAAYWAGVTQLEETKSLPEDRSRTPRESLRLIRRETPAYAPLSQLTRRFELVWYGYRSATAADWTDAMQQLEALGCQRSSTPAISAS